jgi:hypothetical protein
MKRFMTMLMVSVGIFGSTASHADCSALINDAINWASQRDGRNQYYVGFEISSMKAPAKFVSYANGSFTARSGMLAADRVKTVFSDRTWCPDTASGGFCLGNQRFNYRAQDEMSFTLSNTGLLTIVLNTWGNATYRMNLQCENGFLYGTLREPNGNSMVTLNLNKYSVAIPR